MGIFDRISRAFNIGGVAVTVDVEGDEFPQGSRVRGRVRLVGGSFEQTATSVMAVFEEFWHESRGSGKSRRRVLVAHTVAQKTLAEPCVIAKGATQTFDFDFPLPANARLSDPDEGFRVRVALDIPGQVDPSGFAKVTVVPSAAIQGLSAAMVRHLSFRDGRRRFSASDRLTTVRMHPPQELKTHIGHIDLICHHTSSGLAVDVAVDLQEHSLMDYLKAMVGKDVKHFSAQFSTADIEGDGESAARCIGDIITQAVRP
jgi:sporulation-control protein spo0M